MFDVIIVCFLILTLGFIGGAAFNVNEVIPKIAVGLVFIVWTVACFTGGTITAFKQLEHVKMRKVIDGEEKCFITLKLGPLGYTIDVPEEKDGK